MAIENDTTHEQMRTIYERITSLRRGADQLFMFFSVWEIERKGIDYVQARFKEFHALCEKNDRDTFVLNLIVGSEIPNHIKEKLVPSFKMAG